MIPNFPEFEPLSLSHKSAMEKKLRSYPRNMCELSFATLFIWQNFEKPKLTYINDNLCILATPPDEEPYFFEPIGRNSVRDTLSTCMEHAGRISCASTAYAFSFPHICYDIAPIRDHFDYIYFTKDLIELKGRRYDGKRNHIKNFRKRYASYDFRPIGRGNKSEAIKLYDDWFAAKKESEGYCEATSDLSYQSQMSAIETAFENFEELSLRGTGLFINNALQGFVIGSQINSSLACMHFMTASPDLHTPYPLLMSEGCSRLFSEFEYVNLEQDLGLEGLRKSKLSYHPMWLEEKFDIFEQE